MEDLDNTEHEFRDVAGDVAEIPEEAGAQAEKVVDKLEEVAEDASQAAREATDKAEHESMAGVASAMHLLIAELKRSNDLREFETKKAKAVVAENSEVAQAPVAEVVEEVKPRYVRRGGRKVKR